MKGRKKGFYHRELKNTWETINLITNSPKHRRGMQRQDTLNDKAKKKKK